MDLVLGTTLLTTCIATFIVGLITLMVGEWLRAWGWVRVGPLTPLGAVLSGATVPLQNSAQLNCSMLPMVQLVSRRALQASRAGAVRTAVAPTSCPAPLASPASPAHLSPKRPCPPLVMSETKVSHERN